DLPRGIPAGGSAEGQAPVAPAELAAVGEGVVAAEHGAAGEPRRRPPVQAEAPGEAGRPVVPLDIELLPTPAQLEGVRGLAEVARGVHHAVAAGTAIDLNESGGERVVQLVGEAAGDAPGEA